MIPHDTSPVNARAERLDQLRRMTLYLQKSLGEILEEKELLRLAEREHRQSLQRFETECRFLLAMDRGRN